MRYDPDFGLVLKEHHWVPTPRYLLRRARILEIMSTLPRGKVLEIGCGVGALIEDLRRMGHDCTALEISPDARAIARDVHADHPDIAVCEQPQADWAGQFDCLLAFEVLEHIEDDLAALRQWRQWLKPGGLLLLSVPAHMSRWSSSDVWAGHVRRYERHALFDVMKRAGFRIQSIENYGALFNLVSGPARRFLYNRRRRQGLDALGSREEQNLHSGTDRPVETGLWFLLDNPLGRATMKLAARAQKPFRNGERGSGYLAVCRA